MNVKFRTKAEELYEAIPAHQRTQHLFETIIDDNKDEEVRQLAAVLLRRLIFSDFPEIVKSITEEDFEKIKFQTLLLLEKNISKNMRQKVCDIAAELAKNCIDDNGNNSWPQILKFLFDSANANNLELKHSALLIFAAVPGVFGNQQTKYLEVIRQMLIQYLCENSNEEVKISAVKATSAFILVHETEKSVLKQMSDCILPMIH
ncbi:unnamed protein product, partial [Medioppia subpectinata]